MKEMKISGYKSHDAYFIMHHFLQVAVRKVFPKNILLTLIRLDNFFRSICSKVIRPRDLEKLESKIGEITSNLEIIFHPTFFDIMLHLLVHLVNESILGGSIHLRWMYAINKSLCNLKGLVRNRFCPDASISEGYLVEE